MMKNARILVGAVAGVVAVAVVASSGTALADKKKHQTRYGGVHPVNAKHGKGLCHIEVPHVHVYDPPSAKLQFREHDGAQYFVGDPVAYGWDGPRFNYMGHHPLQVDIQVAVGAPPPADFCFISGPHFHAFAPPPTMSADFSLTGDAYFYIGTPPPTYIELQPVMAEVDVEYQAIQYERPVITVTPPEAWIGVRFGGPGRRGRGHAYGHGDDGHEGNGRPLVRGGEVRAGVGVNVVVPVPSVRVDVRLPSVQIGGGGAVIFGGGGGGGGKRHDNGKHRGRGHR